MLRLIIAYRRGSFNGILGFTDVVEVGNTDERSSLSLFLNSLSFSDLIDYRRGNVVKGSWNGLLTYVK